MRRTSIARLSTDGDNNDLDRVDHRLRAVHQRVHERGAVRRGIGLQRDDFASTACRIDAVEASERRSTATRSSTCTRGRRPRARRTPSPRPAAPAPWSSPRTCSSCARRASRRCGRSQRGTSDCCVSPPLSYDNKELSRSAAAGRPPSPRPGCPPPCCRAGRSRATRGRGTPRATETPTCSAPTNRRRGAARPPPP